MAPATPGAPASTGTSESPQNHAAHDDHGHDDDHDHDHGEGSVSELHGHDTAGFSGPWWQTGKGRLTIASGAALLFAFAASYLIPAAGPWPFVAAMLVGLVPIARRAIMAAIAGTPFSIEMLMTIAAVGAVVIGAGEEGATVVFLFLVGELLEGVAAGKTRQSIQSPTTLVPKKATVEDNGKTREVPAEDLAVGATIMVRAGERIPADGIILDGESSIDESPVTGESVPVRKVVDGQVFAGTVNGDGVLRIKVSAAAADNPIQVLPTERAINAFLVGVVSPRSAASFGQF